jgi:hypothetical protein
MRFMYARVIGMVRHLFGVDSFTIVPFQLGEDNGEAIRSGAWWLWASGSVIPLDARSRGESWRAHGRIRAIAARPLSFGGWPATISSGTWASRARGRDRPAAPRPGRAAVTRRLTARHGRDRTAAEDARAREAQALLATDAPRGWSR